MFALTANIDGPCNISEPVSVKTGLNDIEMKIQKNA